MLIFFAEVDDNAYVADWSDIFDVDVLVYVTSITSFSPFLSNISIADVATFTAVSKFATVYDFAYVTCFTAVSSVFIFSVEVFLLCDVLF